MLADPDNFIAQPVISLSVHPTMITDGDGSAASAAAPCRPAAVRAAGREAARAAGRTDARRAARGLAGRQLLARRRQQGYLGAGGVGCCDGLPDNLFWAARNLERAEWRARLVDVNYHLLIETPPRDSAPWEPLLAIFGEIEQFAERHSIADESSVLDFFTLDLENPNSIRSCINVARDNLRSLRHYVSSEFWLDVNTLYLAAQNWTPEVFVNPGVYSFFSDLKDCFYRIFRNSPEHAAARSRLRFHAAGNHAGARRGSFADARREVSLPDAAAGGYWRRRRPARSGRACCAARRLWKPIASASAMRSSSTT